mmetsp:Transcript_86411/g.231450  ORF Transcript_86411/g.231450 Transcript_86411/m.231450 type:complete len:302 (-) Transcript_86411:45-950(-)
MNRSVRMQALRICLFRTSNPETRVPSTLGDPSNLSTSSSKSSSGLSEFWMPIANPWNSRKASVRVTPIGQNLSSSGSMSEADPSLSWSGTSSSSSPWCWAAAARSAARIPPLFAFSSTASLAPSCQADCTPPVPKVAEALPTVSSSSNRCRVVRPERFWSSCFSRCSSSFRFFSCSSASFCAAASRATASPRAAARRFSFASSFPFFLLPPYVCRAFFFCSTGASSAATCPWWWWPPAALRSAWVWMPWCSSFCAWRYWAVPSRICCKVAPHWSNNCLLRGLSSAGSSLTDQPPYFFWTRE